LIKPEYLQQSFSRILSILEVLEHNRAYVNQYPKCEPQLGKRGLYVSVGGQTGGKIRELSMLWLLNFSDGNGFSLLDIAEKSGIKFADLKEAADRLTQSGLLTEFQSKQ
jgi:aminopeptidase-like protein